MLRFPIGKVTDVLVRGPTTPGSGGFSPAMLFAAGELGGWYDPSDLSTLFQDSAGTTPVTASGQPVGRISDKSGRGNHLVQATAGARPTFTIDGSGYSALVFDAADDYLSCGTGGGMTVQEAFAAVNPGGGAGTSRDVLNDSANFRFGANSGNAYFALSTGGIISTVGSATVGVACVIGARNDGVNTIARRNAVDGAGAAGTVTAGAAGFAVGSLEGGTLQRWNGSIYGIVWRANNFTAAQRAQLERYLGGKCGVPL